MVVTSIVTVTLMMNTHMLLNPLTLRWTPARAVLRGLPAVRSSSPPALTGTQPEPPPPDTSRKGLGGVGQTGRREKSTFSGSAQHAV